MGTTWKAKAVIGLRVDASQLYYKKKTKAFKHNHPASMKFDPQTGKPLWEMATFLIDGIDVRTEDFQDILSLGGHTIVFGPNVGSDYKPTEAYISILETPDYEYDAYAPQAPASLPNFPDTLEARKDDLKTKAEKLGLWDESKFGLWAILDWS